MSFFGGGKVAETIFLLPELLFAPIGKTPVLNTALGSPVSPKCGCSGPHCLFPSLLHSQLSHCNTAPETFCAMAHLNAHPPPPPPCATNGANTGRGPPPTLRVSETPGAAVPHQGWRVPGTATLSPGSALPVATAVGYQIHRDETGLQGRHGWKASATFLLLFGHPSVKTSLGRS